MSETKAKLFACDRRNYIWECDWNSALQDVTVSWETLTLEEFAELGEAVRAANSDTKNKKFYMLVEQCPEYERETVFKSLKDFKEKVKKDQEKRQREKEKREREKEEKALERKRKQLEKLQKELGVAG